MIRKSVRKNIVYRYERVIYHSTYYGESIHFKTNIAEHTTRGFPSCTELPSTSHNKSNIFGHFSKTGHEILPEYFEIIQSVKQQTELKLSKTI